MVEYIPGGIFRASFKFCMGDKIREKMEGVKVSKRFSVHFNVHTHIQIGFLNNFENCRSLSEMKPCTRRVPNTGKKH
jgi:hypothetical protein